jgi:hypothetical protein
MNFGEIWKLLLKTTPYLMFRLMIYGSVGLAAGFYLGFLILLAKIFGGAGAVFFLIGLGVLIGLLRLARNYLLYMVQAGHIAVVTELITKGRLPEGVNQVQYGKKIVTERFKEVSVLFVADQLVKGILRAINRTVVRIAEILPIPGLEALAKLMTVVLNFAITYVDESILSYNLTRSQENVWEGSRRGLILYAQNWKPVLRQAAWLAAVNFVAFAVIFIVLLIPFAPLAFLAESQAVKFFWFALAATLAYSLKLAVVNPFSMVAMIFTFNKAIEGQEPNKEWEARLETVSNKFRELKEKARTATAPKAPASA